MDSLSTPEEYDEHQKQGGILAQVDDEMHSDQRDKSPKYTNRDKVKLCKLMNLRIAKERGISIGTLYHELDLKYVTNDIKKRTLHKRKSKKKSNQKQKNN